MWVGFGLGFVVCLGFGGLMYCCWIMLYGVFVVVFHMAGEEAKVLDALRRDAAPKTRRSAARRSVIF